MADRSSLTPESGESGGADEKIEALAASAVELLHEPFSPEVAARVLARTGRSASARAGALCRRVEGSAAADGLELWASWDEEPPPRLDTGHSASPLVAVPATSGDELRFQISVAGSGWGVAVWWRRRDGPEWSEAQRRVLGAVAGLLGAAAERAELDSARHAIDQRQRQNERMEALGWLAAGLARDFDAVMTTIRGYGERALARLRPGESVRADLSEMLLAAERAAEMTRELASLGRRQPARAVRFDLSAWLAGRQPLLRRLAGDSIELAVATEPIAAPLEADPDLLEQAIVTFVLDARERMGGQGSIGLRCDEISGAALRTREIGETLGPRAARISVRDDGPPLPESAANRLFEPFSGGRTPARGGLGLAAAYGIVRQCGGLALLAASDSSGTTFEILLPLVTNEEPSPEPPPAKAGASVAGRATVLLVEDEDLIRDLAEQILVEAGYHVLSAADASEAMALVERVTTPIELLLTDVVMPGVSGADLAHRLLRQHPEMRILYMSGYSDSLIFRYGVLQERAAFLRKPFSAEVLEQRVAELLGRGAGA